MRTWLLFLTLLALPVLAFADATDDFRDGNRLYDSGDFSGSAQRFQSIIDRGYASAPLFYNAGCAYYKAGQLGEAILNFRRAERLAPDDEEIRANLAFVRQFMIDKIEAPQEQQFLGSLGVYLGRLHPNEYFWISLLSVAGVFLFMALKRLGFLSKLGSTPAVVLAVVALVAIASMYWVVRSNYLLDEGVITVEQTEILSGPGSEFELQFEGHEGLSFSILESRNDYYLGLFANKLRGWVKKSAVGKV